MLRVYRTPFSTNVERVALALAHKGLEAEWVDVDPADRSPVERVSGQPLVPVLVDEDGAVVADSPQILRHLEARHPDPPLWPSDPAARAEVDVFVEWFNEVWKGPPNRIDALLDAPDPDREEIARLGARLTGWLDVFEGLLHGRAHLLGDELTAADLIAFPFLKYARGRPAGDEERFHAILDEHLSLAGRPNLARWVERMDALPRA